MILLVYFIVLLRELLVSTVFHIFLYIAIHSIIFALVYNNIIVTEHNA